MSNAKIGWATADQLATWLDNYGSRRFIESFLSNCQGARSRCVYCRQTIALDMAEGGGVPDWGSVTDSDWLDYGCPDSPDTDDEGTGAHLPEGARGWE